MQEYFKPLRRKIGVITLVLACASAGIWIIGLTQSTLFVLYSGDRTEYVVQLDAEAVHLFKEQKVWFIVYQSYITQIVMNFSIPHWSSTISLTLISTCLLLTKP